MLLVALFLRVDSVLVSVVTARASSVRNVDLKVANRLFIAKECYGHVNMRTRTIVDASKGAEKILKTAN